jgi:hypothetical protein
MWGSIDCPHCVSAIPTFEIDIYQKYIDEINILVNTLSKEKFETSIPQMLNSPLTFE